MSQRNPMNDRYQSDKPEGKTRKSAASAKPVSKAGASVRSASSKPQKKGFLSSFMGGGSKEPADKATRAKQQEERKEERVEEKETRKEGRARRRAVSRFVPDTEEFRRLNRKRMIYSAIGMAGMVVAIIVSLVMPEQMVLSIGLMIAAWVFFYIGVRIDTNQLRPLREQGYAAYERKQARKAKKHK